MREAILKNLGALERARPQLSNARKFFKIARANQKLYIVVIILKLLGLRIAGNPIPSGVL